MAFPVAGGVSLKVVVTVNGTIQEKTMRFNADMAIWEVCKEVSEKLSIGGADHGLFQAGSGSRKGRWFKPNITLKGAELLSGSVVEYKKKHRILKVKLIDNSNRTVLIDDSSLLGEILSVVCKKVQINNPDEYGLRIEGKADNDWLNNQQGLYDQDVGPDDTLVLGKRFFVFDANIDRSDPVQLHLFYSQARDAVLGGKYPLSREEAIALAAFQLQVAEGDHVPVRHKKGFLVLEDFLPPEWVKNNKGIEKGIYSEHRKLTGTSELNAKFRYVQLIRNVKSFGITFFSCREKGVGKKKGKWVPVLIGITREKIMRVEPDDRTVIKEYPLKHLKRWAAKVNTFSFDFGDHEDDFYVVQTTQGDAISQLIAGYIDIILKARREAVRQQEEDGASFANAESTSFASGVAFGSTTAAYTASLSPTMQLNMGGPHQALYQNFVVPGMQAGQINTKVLPKSQKVNVIDLKTAQQALLFLAEELDADMESAEFEAYDTTMTIDQVKQALGVSTINLDKNIVGLLDATDPSSLDVEQLNAFAKTITADVLKLAKMARTAAAIGGANDVDIVAGSIKLASSLTKLLEATSKVSLNPHDPKTRDFMNAQNHLVREAMVFLKSAREGRLNDGASEELFQQFAENLDEDVGAAVTCAIAAVKHIKDGTKMREVLTTCKALSAAQQAMAETAKTLSAALIDPEARKCIATVANQIATLNAKLCDQLKEAGITAEVIEQVQVVGNSVNQLLNSVALAEPRSGADLDFAVPHSNILAAIAQLRDAKGDAKLVLSGLKAAMANTTELVGYGRKVAEASDEAGQVRLNNTIQHVNEAMGRLIASAKAVALTPNDPSALAAVSDTTNTLEVLTQELVTDAGASAATIGLRYRAKDAVTRAVKVARILEAALKDITDPALKAQIIQQISKANKAIADLLSALRQAASEPQNPDAQLRLLQAAQRVLMPVSQIVAATKRVAPGVVDANQKQSLNYAANTLTDHLQKLMTAIKNVSELEGQQGLEEALEQFQATDADLDAAEFAAQGGFLVAPPGQSRDDAVALLDQSVNLLLQDLNNVVNGAKDPRSRKLGESAKAVAGAAAQVAASVKTVASTTTDKTMQKSVLAQAKRFNKDVSGVISAARALISRREEPALQAALNNSQQAVLNALSSLTAAARGLDSREVDEAMDLITKESAKLNYVSPSSGATADAQKNSQETMISSAKALNAALAQLANVARANPRALGPAAKLASTTVVQFISAATIAGQSSLTAEQADGITKAALDLIGRTNAFISAAKSAAARKDQPTYNQLNAALVAVSKAVESLSNRNQFPECTTAAERVAVIAALLADPAAAKDKGTLTPAQILAVLDQVCNNLAQAVQQLVSAARIGSPQLGIFAKDAAENVDILANAAISSTLTGVSRATMSGPRAEIMQAVTTIVNNIEDPLIVSASTKQIAGSAAKIIGSSKVTAATITDRDAQQALLKIAHGFASATAQIARSAQAAKTPDYNEKLIAAANELKLRTQEIENATRAAEEASSGATSQASSGSDNVISPQSAAQLVAASQATANMVATLIKAAGAAGSEPESEASSQELNFASRGVSDAIGDLVKAAAAFNPGKVQLEATAETLQAAVGELDAASIQIAIGKIESPVASTKAHKEWQDTLVAISRDLVGATSSLVEATRADAAILRRVAAEINKHVPSLVSATKAAAATSSDSTLQKNLLSNAKDLASSLLGLVRAAKDANAQNRQSQLVLVERSKKCSQSIGKFVSLLKANAVIYQELDEAAKQIAAMARQIDTPATSSGRAYNEIRESLQQTILSVAEKASAISSADKSNLGQVGLQARQLCDILPKFIAQIRDAAATTADPTARADITGTSKALINSIANLLNAAKAADPKNPATEQAITAAFDQSSQISATVLKALKSGATGEILIEQAIERAKDAVVILNHNTIFAQAGQLEPVPDMVTVTITAARVQLAALAKNIAVQAAQMAEATRKNQEEFGAAARELAETVHTVSNYTVKAATKLPDNVSQQNLLTAAKAVAIASQQLIMTGRETQRNANPTTLQQLTQSVDTTRTCIDQLLQVSENASAEAARGEKGLEEAKVAVQAALDGFDAFQGAQAEDVIRVAKDITRAVSALVFAQNQEASTVAAGQLVEANKTLLATSRGASSLTSDSAVKKALVGSSANVAGASIQLLESCKFNREDEQAQNKIFECSSAVTVALSELVKAINLLPNANNLSLDELSANKGAEANDEIDKAGKLILDAAKQLDASCQEVAHRKANASNTTSSQAEFDRLLRQGEIAEAILSAARAITQATSRLVSCAAVCQKERASEPGPIGQRYRNDPTWNNGLISAARAVSDAVIFLVRTANTVLDNKQDEDALVVAAKGIATSTAQLVTASKVRGPAANSKSQQDLSAAAKAVAQATNQLMVATRNASDAAVVETSNEGGDFNPMGGKVKEFEEQMRILKLERELLAARKNLGDMRKAQYKQ